jgi:hypothetical protein
LGINICTALKKENLISGRHLASEPASGHLFYIQFKILCCRELPLNSTGPAHPFSDLPSLLTDFLPTLMIWTFTALLPVLVAYSDRLLGHWTR